MFHAAASVRNGLFELAGCTFFGSRRGTFFRYAAFDLLLAGRVRSEGFFFDLITGALTFSLFVRFFAHFGAGFRNRFTFDFSAAAAFSGNWCGHLTSVAFLEWLTCDWYADVLVQLLVLSRTFVAEDLLLLVAFRAILAVRCYLTNLFSGCDGFAGVLFSLAAAFVDLVGQRQALFALYVSCAGFVLAHPNFATASFSLDSLFAFVKFATLFDYSILNCTFCAFFVFEFVAEHFAVADEAIVVLAAWFILVRSPDNGLGLDTIDRTAYRILYSFLDQFPTFVRRVTAFGIISFGALWFRLSLLQDVPPVFLSVLFDRSFDCVWVECARPEAVGGRAAEQSEKRNAN